MKLDHFAWSSASLERAIDDLELWSGVRAEAGGSHPGMGTRNALISLGEGLYLALDAPDPKQKLEANNGARMAAQTGYNVDLFAVATDDIIEAQKILKQFGIQSQVRAASRMTLEGRELKWRHLEVGASQFGNALPHIAQWDTTNHPSLEAPVGCSLDRFEVRNSRPPPLRELYEALGLSIDLVDSPEDALYISLRGVHGQFQLPTGFKD